MPSSSKKRKTADEDTTDVDIDADADADDSPPNLPSSSLAAVLNFSEHSTVRQCMLAGKTAIQAAKKMETLNITRPAEMLVPALRARFPNVKEINILCLVSQRPDDEDSQVLSAEAVTRVLPLMMAFPKLEKVYLGGMARDNGDGTLTRQSYNHNYCKGPEDHREIFRGLVESLCGAFESRSLKQNLALGGLDFALQLDCWQKGMFDREMWRSEDEAADWTCRCCRRIMKSLPLELILDLEVGCLTERYPGFENKTLCMPMSHRLEVFTSREDAVKFLRTIEGKNYFVNFILSSMFARYEYRRDRHELGKFFYRMLAEHGAVDSVVFLTKRSVRSLRRTIDLMIPLAQPGFIPPHFFGTSLPWYLRSGSHSGKRILLREAFQVSVDLGFDLDARDYVIVDLHEEPALEPLRGFVG